MEDDPNTEKGDMSEGLIKGSMDRAVVNFYGEEQFKGIFEKTAALIHSIITFHPFIDGNKRTALLAAFWFLWFHGYGFEITTKDVIQTLLKIAKGEITNIEKIAEWVKKNSEKQDFEIRARLTVLRYFVKEIDLPSILRGKGLVAKLLTLVRKEWPE